MPESSSLSDVGKINLHYTDQQSHIKGMHRSGWPYVLSLLEQLHDENGVWCDTYVDRTFHWGGGANIPYRQPWIGFVHHTFDTKHSDYNNVTLLKNPKFLESLTTCRGLFVFSQHLKSRWDAELCRRGFLIHVRPLTHPTEAVPDERQFSMRKFSANAEKQVISVGAWLRDTYAIYELNEGRSPIRTQDRTYTKAALQGPNMQRYFKPRNFFHLLTRPAWKSCDFRPPLSEVQDEVRPVEGLEIQTALQSG